MSSPDSRPESRPAPKSEPLALDKAILAVLHDAAGKTLGAPEIAHALRPGDASWHDLLAPIRKTAIELARAGRLLIYRKGKLADPDDLRGVYRLGLPRQD